MVTNKRYVKLNLGNERLGVHYEYKHFFTSTCTESYSKYLCLSLDDAYVAYFTMEVSDNKTCSFQFYDGPYKGQWMHYDDGYLYVTSKYDDLAGVFSDDGNSVKLYTIKNGTKHWFKRGNKYKNDACGNYYYVVTTTNESEALTSTITDIPSGLLDPRDRPIISPFKKAYFFKGNQYIQYDIATDRVDEGYPKPIAANWPGLEAFLNVYPERIDAAVHWDNQKIYVFKGSQYFCYDAATAQADSGYPKPIKGNWVGLDAFADRIDDAVNLDNGKVYFFKGSQCIRYDIATNKADEGYPKPIKSDWPGTYPDGIDAVVNLGKGKVYFFRNSEYIRYDIAAKKADYDSSAIKGVWGLGAFGDEELDAGIAF